MTIVDYADKESQHGIHDTNVIILVLLFIFFLALILPAHEIHQYSRELMMVIPREWIPGTAQPRIQILRYMDFLVH